MTKTEKKPKADIAYRKLRLGGNVPSNGDAKTAPSPITASSPCEATSHPNRSGDLSDEEIGTLYEEFYYKEPESILKRNNTAIRLVRHYMEQAYERGKKDGWQDGFDEGVSQTEENEREPPERSKSEEKMRRHGHARGLGGRRIRTQGKQSK